MDGQLEWQQHSTGGVYNLVHRLNRLTSGKSQCNQACQMDAYLNLCAGIIQGVDTIL